MHFVDIKSNVPAFSISQELHDPQAFVLLDEAGKHMFMYKNTGDEEEVSMAGH